MLMCHRKYAMVILARADMSSCKSAAPLVHTKSKISASIRNPFYVPSLYRQMTGALQYLTFTCPNISYGVQQVCLSMHAPRDSHFHALKRILCYLKGTLDYGMHLPLAPVKGLVSYTDVD